MSLSEKAHKATGYIGYQVNRLTRTKNDTRWRRNVQTNKKYYIKGNPKLKGLVAYVIGAGPSLDKNVEELKGISSRGIIVCIDANFEYLVNKGIIPEYCVSIDASDKIYDMIKSVIKKTKNTILVCNTASNPKLIAAWKGSKFFFTSPDSRFPSKSEERNALTRYAIAKKDIKKGDEIKASKSYKIVFPGVKLEMGCGGNVTTSAHVFCHQVLRVFTIVFVGCDFSWENASHFYSGRKHLENIRARTLNEQILSHFDIDKKRVNTNISLESFKRWHENVAMLSPGTESINATEGGILGIDAKTGNKEPFIKFMKLKDAVKKYTPKDEVLWTDASHSYDELKRLGKLSINGHNRKKKCKNSCKA